jgi:hypothetical protein
VIFEGGIEARRICRHGNVYDEVVSNPVTPERRRSAAKGFRGSPVRGLTPTPNTASRLRRCKGRCSRLKPRRCFAAQAEALATCVVPGDLRISFAALPAMKKAVTKLCRPCRTPIKFPPPPALTSRAMIVPPCGLQFVREVDQLMPRRIPDRLKRSSLRGWSLLSA